MSRLVIMTVGKTHSGKSTFARALAGHLPDSIVIDQDNHAEFINTHYRALLPQQGPNTIKYAVTRTIVDYAARQTDLHLILCNSNGSRKGRTDMLARFREQGFKTVLVHFDLPLPVLQTRIKSSGRSTAIFKHAATTFEDVLNRQHDEFHNGVSSAPTEDESDHLYIVRDPAETAAVIQAIAGIAHRFPV